MRTAAIGIGSNSLRMLIADVGEGKLTRLGRYREGLRVFAALDEQKRISSDMIKKACEKIQEFANEAIKYQAEEIHLFATSAVRDASNAEAFSNAIFESTGLVLRICSGNEEAELSFAGATDCKPSGMIDIGGGSTEIVVGNGTDIHHAMSFQMGAVRLFRMFPLTDGQMVDQVIEYVRTLVKAHKDHYLSFPAEEWIGVGGTFTTTAAFVQQVPWDNRSHIHGFALTLENVMQAIRTLAPMTLEERKALPYLQAQRADIIVHGLCILAGCMLELNIPQMIVSEYGNLEGFLKKQYLNN